MSTLSLWEGPLLGPLNCTGIFTLPLCSLGQVTQENHVGVLVLFIYISIKRILICTFVVCSGESEGLVRAAFPRQCP